MDALGASGYLLEQDVATTLAGLGLAVSTNRAFRDPDEDKSREIDVQGLISITVDKEHSFQVIAEVLCECKRHNAPLVFLSRAKTPADDVRIPQEYVFPNATRLVPSHGPEMIALNSVTAYEQLGLGPLHYYTSQRSKAVQFARLTRDKGQWAASHGGLFESIFYPLAKALTARQSDVAAMQGPGWGRVWLFFPIVVVHAPMFVVDVHASPQTAVPTNHVTFVRELRTGTVSGFFMVDFVTKDHLSTFVADCVLPFARAVATACDSQPQIVGGRF